MIGQFFKSRMIDEFVTDVSRANYAVMLRRMVFCEIIRIVGTALFPVKI